MGQSSCFFNDLTHTVAKVVVMLQTDCNVINLLLLTGLFQTWLKIEAKGSLVWSVLSTSGTFQPSCFPSFWC